jgi:predicted transcriptional regulator of viral defense system
MKNLSTTEHEVLTIARDLTVLRIKDLTERGIHPEHARRLCAKGLLLRFGRGIYMPVDTDFSENVSLAQVFKWVPRGVVCLLSALRFHEIGTQLPFEVWLALERGCARPRLGSPRLRVVWFSGAAFREGVETHLIDGVQVRIYNPAKTIADCFKFRNKVGLDVALEALRECLRDRKATVTELTRYAKTCRVWNVMRPYVEAMVV